MSEQALLRNETYRIFGNLPQANLICAFTNRRFKNMSLRYGKTQDSLKNRQNFLNNLGIDYRNLVCAKQVHGSKARYVKAEDIGRGALSYDTAISDTDAIITNEKNLPLAVFTADCLSIFIYDPSAAAIGLVHAGWRSTQENIVVKTIQLMQKEFASRPENLCAGFGPAIRSCCCQVGEEFKDAFLEGLIQVNGNYHLDLARLNKKQLLGLGVKESNIFDSQICTSCQHTEFFSYRKEGASCGRMMSVMMLR